MLQSLLVWESGAVKSAQRKQELLFKEVKKERKKNKTKPLLLSVCFPFCFLLPESPEEGSRAAVEHNGTCVRDAQKNGEERVRS